VLARIFRMALRLFLALAVPSAVKSALAAVRDELESELPHARISWTRVESMHLTLRFLGEVFPSDVQPLRDTLAVATRDFGPLELTCERLGCFPDIRSPRILWGWVHDAADRLELLSRQITAASLPFTREAAEARFTGHVTLGRVRQKLRLHDARKIADFLNGKVHRVFGSWIATTVELVQSELASGGSQYTVLEKFSLTKGRSAAL
jgi:2'-5' RNA ligase